MAQTNTIQQPTAAADHYHRWRIDEPNGPRSIGVCKTCGATKEFKNWLSDGDFITNEEHRMAA
ncbi:MAG: hypothetical protein IT303_06310 [Dehalococcoidia bacterium]|nr:hypothetical protein [Dehalococcoidia bacterium]